MSAWPIRRTSPVSRSRPLPTVGWMPADDRTWRAAWRQRFVEPFQLVAQKRLNQEEIFPRRIDDSEHEPDRSTVAAECGPGDRGVEGHVGQLVQDLVEPPAECRAGSLQAGEAAVGGVQHQGQCEGQAPRPTGRSSRSGPTATSDAAESIKIPEVRVKALGVIEVGQSRSASRRARGNAQYLPSG